MFKRKNKPSENKQATKNYFTVLHQKATDYLHGKTYNWKKPQKIIFLICLYILIGGSSIYCLLNIGDTKSAFRALFQKSDATHNSYPAINLPDAINIEIDSQLIKQFNKVVDSISRTDSGRIQLDQFRKERPGFFDSLNNASSFFKHFIIP